MKVKYLRGDNKKNFLVVIPEGNNIHDLAENIQEVIKHLGNLTVYRTRELPSNSEPLSQEIIAGINKEGAFLIKYDVQFQELTPDKI